jgi:hypothetical protein
MFHASTKSSVIALREKKFSRNRLPNSQALSSIRHPAAASLSLGNPLSKKASLRVLTEVRTDVKWAAHPGRNVHGATSQEVGRKDL